MTTSRIQSQVDHYYSVLRRAVSSGEMTALVAKAKLRHFLSVAVDGALLDLETKFAAEAEYELFCEGKAIEKVIDDEFFGGGSKDE